MVRKSEHHQQSTCPIACGLDIIGDHWALLVVRNMMFFDIHEYKDFLSMPEAIASNILSDRLKKLEEAAIIASIPHPDSKRRKLYYLTSKGKDMIFILMEIGRWSSKHLTDRVIVPDQIKTLSQKTPHEIMHEIFCKLDEWESRYL